MIWYMIWCFCAIYNIGDLTCMLLQWVPQSNIRIINISITIVNEWFNLGDKSVISVSVRIEIQTEYLALLKRLTKHPLICECCIEHALQCRHNGHDSVSNHKRLNCLLNHFYGHRSKKTSNLCITGLCERNSPGTGEFPAQTASNAGNVPI